MKYSYLAFTIICLLYLQCSFSRYSYTYFYSPDKSRCITFIEDSAPIQNVVYLIPQKISENDDFHKFDYLQLGNSETPIYFKWDKKIRIIYSSIIENKLDTNIVDFTTYSRKSDLDPIDTTKIAKGFEYYFPEQILTGKYKRIRASGEQSR